MSPWLFNVYMGRKRERFLEEEKECGLPCLLYADEFVLCGESEEDLKAMMSCFVEVCRKYLKPNANESKIMVFGGGRGTGV